MVSQETNVEDWVWDDTYWDWRVPLWYTEIGWGSPYPDPDFLAELIAPPGSTTDKFYFTIQIDTSQADATGKYRFYFCGGSYRNPPPLGGLM